MNLTVEVKLTDDRLRDLPKRLWEAGDKLVRRTAFAVEREAKINTPVDTGFLRNSIYTVTSEGSGYDKAQINAERLGVKRHAFKRKSAATGRWELTGDMLPEAENDGELTAVVAVGAEYGVWVEYGTARAAAQPFLEPAIEAAREEWERGLEKLFDEAIGGVAAS